MRKPGQVMFEDLIASRVRPLAEAMMQSGLESIRVADAEVEIELVRRNAAGLHTQAREPDALADGAMGATPAYDVLTSDVVGRVRFLRPPVTAGTVVEDDRELAFVEALGIRNPIRSRGRGRVAVVYVEEGQVVDYGAPLFALDRSHV
jgi:biotin carboxyl carrier protein